MLFRFLLIGTLTFIYACSREVPSDPMCRLDPKYEELAPEPAACLIKLNDKLVAIKEVNQSTLSVPKRKIEKHLSAQCNAHKAAWKTTGFNVQVGELLSLPSEEIHYFACNLNESFSTDIQSFPVPNWASRKVNEIVLVDPFDTQAFEWSDRINLVELRRKFNQLD